MSSPDIELLALFSNRKTYDKYKSLVHGEQLLVGETAQLLKDFEEYYKTYPTDPAIDWGKMRTYTRVIRHPEWKQEKHELNEMILNKIEEKAVAGVALDILDHFTAIKTAGAIYEKASAIVRGAGAGFDDIQKLLDDHKAAVKPSGKGLEELFGPSDLSKILTARYRTDGIEWRTEQMDSCVGPLRGGDFVVLSGRPEAGKTSWLCSELTHMVKFLPADKKAVLFNPEEGGGRVFLRLVTAATGLDLATIAADEIAALEAYKKAIDGDVDRIRVVEPSGGITMHTIEQVLDTGEYGVVGINVLDKIKTKFNRNEKEVEKYRNLALWVRELANKYDVPILSVVQADGAAEGVKYLNMSMIYGSKTGVQGEADLLIGVGIDPAVDDRRTFSLLKNKLPGGPHTAKGLKHARFDLKFDSDTGRFTDP